jgi:crossover junction endodeoxyribonuclease RuvC
MKILGLDLSLTGTGCILLDDGKVKVRQLIKSKPLGNRPIDELERLLLIKRKIGGIVLDEKPDLVIIEGMAFMAHNTTALTQLAGLNYMIREFLYEHDIKFLLIAPTTLKKFATGRGNCQKDLILLEVYKRYEEEFSDDNLCDAFCLAKVGERTMVDDNNKLPKFQQEVIKIIKEQYYG